MDKFEVDKEDLIKLSNEIKQCFPEKDDFLAFVDQTIKLCYVINTLRKMVKKDSINSSEFSITFIIVMSTYFKENYETIRDIIKYIDVYTLIQKAELALKYELDTENTEN